MDNSYPYPQADSVDVLGRTFSAVIGYSEQKLIPIPIGTRVRLMPEWTTSAVDSFFDKSAFGAEAIVTAFLPGKRRPDGGLVFWEKDHVRVRFVDVRGHWETAANYRVWDVRWIEVLELGSGEIADGSYELMQEEIWDQRWKALDHTHQGWSNPPTFLAQLYLDNDSRHQGAVLGMVRKDGSINPTRLATYFRRSGLHIDGWSWYPDPFPQHYRYRYRVNWSEIAVFFANKAKEHRAFREQQAA